MRVGIPARTLCRDYLPLPIVRTINSAWGLRERLQNFRPGAAWKGRLWVNYGSPAWAPECPVLGEEQTSISGGWRSAFSQEETFADSPRWRRHTEDSEMTCAEVEELITIPTNVS